MLNRCCIIDHQTVVKLTVYFTDWQPGEQREIPGVIAVRASIDAPDIQQLLLRIHPDGAGRGEVAFYIAGGAAFGNVLIPHRRDSPCDFHNVPFLTHTKTRSVQNGPNLFMYEKYFLDIFQMVKKDFQRYSPVEDQKDTQRVSEPYRLNI